MLDTATTNCLLNVFDGHPTPALFTPHNNGWRPAPELPKRAAFQGHLKGNLKAGSYPFNGDQQQPSCNYFTIDIDDKRKQRTAPNEVRRLLQVSQQYGMSPMLATSKSGYGVHAHYFFEHSVPLNVAFAVARRFRDEARIAACDIMPGSRPRKGYGALHAMPLSPWDYHHNGGLLLDHNLYIYDRSQSCQVLDHFHRHRNSTVVARQIFAETPLPTLPTQAQTLVETDIAPQTLAFAQRLFKTHRTIKEILAVDDRRFPGKTSAKSVRIASTLKRLGLSANDAVEATKVLYGGKLVSKPGAATALKQYLLDTAVDVLHKERYAGQIKGERKTRRDNRYANREQAPISYGAINNPWYSDEVQCAINNVRPQSREVLKMVSAFIVDYWFHGGGFNPRTTFPMSRSQISELLRISEKQVRTAIDNIDRHLHMLIHVRRGASCHISRIANRYSVLLENGMC